MRFRSCGCAVALLALVGCGDDTNGFNTPDGASDSGSGAEAGDAAGTRDAGTDASRPPADAGDNLDMTIVYAHSDTTLYAVDPHGNTFTNVGDFAFPAGDTHSHTMTDLAVDATGGVVGVTQNALWRIAPTSAACTLLTPLPGSHSFVGLTYLPVGVLDPANEVLVGGATDGTYWRIDPANGNATMLGRFQGGWQLSGDIVSVAGAATYATVRQTTSGTDSLATIDPATGAIHILGDTHYQRIYGLGYWRATLYGFTRSGQFLTIDARNASTHQVSMPVMQFSGAGVTTVAPVTPG